MYLSRIALDVQKRNTMIALTNPQKIHGAIESSFPGERSRRLWRLDKLGGKLYLLLLSEQTPDFTKIIAQFGTGEKAETREMTSLLSRVKNGSIWRFRLTANPTVSLSSKNGARARSTVHAHITTEYQKHWLIARAEKHGFVLPDQAFDVTEVRWLRFKKESKGRPVTLLSVTYEGILQVTDENALCQLLCEGIGKGKAYGLGMMTIMPVVMPYD